MSGGGAKRNQHVFPANSGTWSVRKDGAERATRTFDNKDDAVTFARVLARRDGTELYVHRRDGLVSESSTYVEPDQPKAKSLGKALLKDTGLGRGGSKPRIATSAGTARRKK